MCVYCIMHSGDMQDLDSLAHLVHNRHPRADLVYDSRSTNPRRDCNRCHRNRSRNRRT
jgi:hypothetical protein